MVPIFVSKKIIFCFLGPFLVFISCNNQSTINKDPKVFYDIISIADFHADPSVVVIVPRYICLDCNTHIFLFCQQILASNNEVVFIYLNEKEGVMKFLPDLKDSPSILFIPYHDSLKIKYPTIIKLDQNKIEKIEFQCIDNPYVLSRLIKHN